MDILEKYIKNNIQILLNFDDEMFDDLNKTIIEYFKPASKHDQTTLERLSIYAIYSEKVTDEWFSYSINLQYYWYQR